mmetsp:Transcript_2269/g.2571  ORF Transcript_2269/g.2571 Transcript_2269/m.2571 type:complete len:413 (-) Transcript_2269:902-2140(-)|eukprot:CAMPEP_0184017016 /NCGR_PEP_ID=MMETSP0954-20121128/7268_1 /TAXON_ID=627963 /ORGANISM="Aplanochytrium sp, Strain PBS07" /LENGTH=412 /DNA_ID=CAMNT_0026298137 /DNA_START=458 /DNA_END=1696 /DNA_ORIENTATION=+
MVPIQLQQPSEVPTRELGVENQFQHMILSTSRETEGKPSGSISDRTKSCSEHKTDTQVSDERAEKFGNESSKTSRATGTVDILNSPDVSTEAKLKLSGSTESTSISSISDKSMSSLSVNNNVTGASSFDSMSTSNMFLDSPSCPISSGKTEGAELRYRNQCVSMVSIAQGGLKRIRRDARTAHVTLMDVIEMFGVAITEIAQYNDMEIARKGWGCESPERIFDAKNKSISVPSYLWNIVLSLNRHADPSFFATDGSALSLSDSKTSLDSGSKSKDSQNTPDSLSQSEDDSAMGRGLRCLLLALVYIDRIGVKHPNRFRLTTSSVHKIMLTAIYVAAKFTDDSLPCPHRFFAHVGGVSTRKLKKLESVFCQLIDFDFHVTDVEFQALCMEQLRWAVRGARNRNEMKKARSKRQ